MGDYSTNQPAYLSTPITVSLFFFRLGKSRGSSLIDINCRERISETLGGIDHFFIASRRALANFVADIRFISNCVLYAINNACYYPIKHGEPRVVSSVISKWLT